MVGDEKSVLGSGTSTSCKVQRVGEACAHDALAAAIHEACVQAGASPSQITRTCAGVTGAGRAEIANTMQRLLSGIVSGEVEVVGDVEVAFEDAFGGGPGVLVIAGTGSIAYGRNVAGEIARAGGWGPTVSDEGSGYWIGREAVKAALREHDAQRRSSLLSGLMEALGAKEFDEFIVGINAVPAPDYAALFPVTQHCADQGDAVGLAVLEHAAKELACMTQVLVRRLFQEKAPIEIATYGGVFTVSAQLRESFRRTLGALVPRASLSSKVVDAARGALNRARNDRSIS